MFPVNFKPIFIYFFGLLMVSMINVNSKLFIIFIISLILYLVLEVLEICVSVLFIILRMYLCKFTLNFIGETEKDVK